MTFQKPTSVPWALEFLQVVNLLWFKLVWKTVIQGDGLPFLQLVFSLHRVHSPLTLNTHLCGNVTQLFRSAFLLTSASVEP